MDPEIALEAGFAQWLETVAGGATPLHRVSQGRTLTPYGTSMRVTKAITGWLGAIEHGVAFGGARQEQRVVDLRGIGLLEPDLPVRRSELGSAVLAEWRRLGVADELDEHEVIRAVALCRRGVLGRHLLYQNHLRFWSELRRLRAPADWFADPGALVLATYLDRTVDGYNPFKVLVALNAAFSPLADWSAWADRSPVPDGWPTSRLRHLMDRVEGFASRRRGILTYCKAMEAIYLAVSNPAALPPIAGDLST